MRARSKEAAKAGRLKKGWRGLRADARPEVSRDERSQRVEKEPYAGHERAPAGLRRDLNLARVELRRALSAYRREAQARHKAEQTVSRLREDNRLLAEGRSVAVADPRWMLRSLSAQRRYAPLLERRAISELHRSGLTQAQIAELGGVSQAHVSRTLKLVADHPEVLDTTPLEVGWRYATGQIGEDAMLEELKAWPYTLAGSMTTHGSAARGMTSCSSLRTGS